MWSSRCVLHKGGFFTWLQITWFSLQEFTKVCQKNFCIHIKHFFSSDSWNSLNLPYSLLRSKLGAISKPFNVDSHETFGYNTPSPKRIWTLDLRWNKGLSPLYPSLGVINIILSTTYQPILSKMAYHLKMSAMRGIYWQCFSLISFCQIQCLMKLCFTSHGKIDCLIDIY